jgi:hypothetical protein
MSEPYFPPPRKRADPYREPAAVLPPPDPSPRSPPVVSRPPLEGPARRAKSATPDAVAPPDLGARLTEESDLLRAQAPYRIVAVLMTLGLLFAGAKAFLWWRESGQAGKGTETTIALVCIAAIVFGTPFVFYLLYKRLRRLFGVLFGA